MKRSLLVDIASQGCLIFFIWLSVRNIHRHPQDTVNVNIALFSIIFFTAVCTASLTIAIGRHARKQAGESKLTAAVSSTKKDRMTPLWIIIPSLVVGAIFLLFVK